MNKETHKVRDIEDTAVALQLLRLTFHKKSFNFQNSPNDII